MGGEVADKIGDARPLGQQRIGQLEDPLEIEIPCSKAQLSVEHRHTVAHVVEGDAQLGLALADLVQEPRIVHRDHRLCGKALQESDLFLRERLDLAAARRDVAKERVVLTQRDHQKGAETGILGGPSRRVAQLGGYRQCVWNV